jgi:GrpB-like predicted nucleotidyltransferase (UPF0157 family)
MIAKPQIDMIGPVGHIADAHAAAERLAGLGYAARAHRIDAVLYVEPGERLDDAAAVYRHSLHLTKRDSELWRERLLFRNALRADTRLRDEYIDLKLAMLASRAPYSSLDKREFVRRVLAEAGHELREGLHVG